MHKERPLAFPGCEDDFLAPPLFFDLRKLAGGLDLHKAVVDFGQQRLVALFNGNGAFLNGEGFLKQRNIFNAVFMNRIGPDPLVGGEGNDRSGLEDLKSLKVAVDRHHLEVFSVLEQLIGQAAPKNGDGFSDKIVEPRDADGAFPKKEAEFKKRDDIGVVKKIFAGFRDRHADDCVGTVFKNHLLCLVPGHKTDVDIFPGGSGDSPGDIHIKPLGDAFFQIGHGRIVAIAHE